jgi:molybdopterin biosynthesis enzyme
MAWVHVTWARTAARIATGAPLPPGADLYLLRGVLKDWPDREAKAIMADAQADAVISKKNVPPVYN